MVWLFNAVLVVTIVVLFFWCCYLNRALNLIRQSMLMTIDGCQVIDYNVVQLYHFLDIPDRMVQQPPVISDDFLEAMEEAMRKHREDNPDCPHCGGLDEEDELPHD